MKLYVDGSTDPQSKVGYGSFLLVKEGETRSLEAVSRAVRVKRFHPTTASRFELQTLLWALDEFEPVGESLTVFTDSQTIVGLPDRRQSLEEKQFRSSKGKPLANGDLYQKIYYMLDRFQIELVKIKGHSPSAAKTWEAKFFELVDRVARQAVRSEVSKS